VRAVDSSRRRPRDRWRLTLGSAREHPIEVVVSPAEGDPPFPIEAIAIEDDTYFVLGADPEFQPSSEHPIRVHTAALEAKPAAPGSVVVRQGRPLELLAVVHDLARDPTWQEEWVDRALVEILCETRRRRIAALGLPILGSLHGAMTAAGFVRGLEKAIAGVNPTSLQRLWLIVPAEGEAEVRELLRSRGAGAAER
jgi:hypothetical protein